MMCEYVEFLEESDDVYRNICVLTILEKGGAELFDMSNMNKSKGKYAQNDSAEHGRFLFLSRHAGNLWLIGLSILLVSILGVMLRWQAALQAGSVGYMLIVGEELEYLLAGLTVLTGCTLLLDYMERAEEKKGAL